MSYALVEDVAATWERYAVIARSLQPVPDGLVLHVAGPTDEGFRIIEVWESEAAWQAFEVGRRGSIDALDPAVPSRPVRRHVHAAHVVMGDPWRDRTELPR